MHTGRLWLLWLSIAAMATLVMIQVRSRIEEVQVVLVYLLLVLGASATTGRLLGFLLSALAFVAIDYWFQLPYDLVSVAKPVDWFVLVAFLVTAVVATQLLARARERESEARRHAAEAHRLAREVEHAEALRSAEHFKDMLLASVSHDLRTPLTTIKALAESLEGPSATTSGTDLKARSAVIAEQADRLTHLVDNVLDLSRIRGGALPVALEVHAVEDLVGAALRQAKGVLGGRQVDFQIDLGAPALMGCFDFGHSLRALGNLIQNAAKYSFADTPITITVGREERLLVIAVSDRGAGVAPAERPRIFDAFYRPSGRPPDVGGSGLGLSIARQLAELQGGSVDYAPRPGGGSTFVLRLSAAEYGVDDSDRGAAMEA